MSQGWTMARRSWLAAAAIAAALLALAALSPACPLDLLQRLDFSLG